MVCCFSKNCRPNILVVKCDCLTLFFLKPSQFKHVVTFDHTSFGENFTDNNNLLLLCLPIQKYKEVENSFKILSPNLRANIGPGENTIDMQFEDDNNKLSEYCELADLSKLDLPQTESLLVLHTNIRSLVKNVGKLEELLSDMDYNYKPDLIAVTETWIEPSRLPKVQLTGYTFTHADSVNAGSNGTGLAGGVGLYVKECLIVTPCKDIDLDAINCENLWVNIPLKNEKTLTLGIVYRHPKSNLVEF